MIHGFLPITDGWNRYNGIEELDFASEVHLKKKDKAQEKLLVMPGEEIDL